jgi:hypothetical protein
MEVWLVYVDVANGEDRESWSVFYTEVTVCSSHAEAVKQGKLAQAALAETEDDYTVDDFIVEIQGPFKVV